MSKKNFVVSSIPIHPPKTSVPESVAVPVYPEAQVQFLELAPESEQTAFAWPLQPWLLFAAQSSISNIPNSVTAKRSGNIPVHPPKISVPESVVVPENPDAQVQVLELTPASVHTAYVFPLHCWLPLIVQSSISSKGVGHKAQKDDIRLHPLKTSVPVKTAVPEYPTGHVQFLELAPESAQTAYGSPLHCWVLFAIQSSMSRYESVIIDPQSVPVHPAKTSIPLREAVPEYPELQVQFLRCRPASVQTAFGSPLHC